MYEEFGFSRWPDGRLGFRLFVPDNSVDPGQYQRGGPCRIRRVRVYGSFQGWDEAGAIPMQREHHPHGIVFSAAVPQDLAHGFYEYKYLVDFENGELRYLGDPCTKHSGLSNDNSAFVYGGQAAVPEPLPDHLRRSGHDLMIYELMLDDFTRDYRGSRSPVEALADKLTHLKDLNINAIEFMPWISWPDGDGFSWGYDPAFYFAVESQLVASEASSLERLSTLANMITACHHQGLMVILDIVLQHAHQGEPCRGFPYFWLWQNTNDSPFVGAFTDADAFGNVPLDYNNACTLEFVTDVCRYWADAFAVDGFRFDQVSGFHNHSRPQQGAPALIQRLNRYVEQRNLKGRFPLILEDTWDDQARVHANRMQATHAWNVPFQGSMAALIGSGQHPGPWFMRILNAADRFDFPISPIIYLESHDRPTLINSAGGRANWFKLQPFAIALATCPGSIMLGQGQEFGRSEWFPDEDHGMAANEKRINPRPLRWSEAGDDIGRYLRHFYARLLNIRREHAALRSPEFYPATYQDQWTEFNPEGYGVHQRLGVVIYHRYNDYERLLIVLNFSQRTAIFDIPFPRSGSWTELLEECQYEVQGGWLKAHQLSAHWGRIFVQA